MNFKELTSALAREAGVSGGGTISTVSSPTGETARLVNWIRQANMDIQRRYFDWKFLWQPFSLTTEAGKSTYDAPLEWHWWDRDKIQIDGEPFGGLEEYELWNGLERTDQGAPNQVIIMPDGSLKILPVPDKAYTLSMPYYRKPQKLAVDTDIPLIPEEFHDLIWMWALVKYAHYEAAPEVIERVQTEYPAMLQSLESHQLPNRYRYALSQDANPLTVVPE